MLFEAPIDQMGIQVVDLDPEVCISSAASLYLCISSGKVIAMQYVVQLVQALAWPTVAVWLAYLFRTEFKGLLGRIKKMKYKDAEAEFNEALASAAEQAALELPRPQQDTRALPQQGGDPRYLMFSGPNVQTSIEVAKASPRAAIVEAWTRVEQAIDGVLVERGMEANTRTQPTRKLILFQELGILPNHMMDTLKELRGIRNQASHASDFEPSFADAVLYSNIVQRVLDAIEQGNRG